MTDTNHEGDRLELPGGAEAIRDEQVGRALRRLEENGGITPRQRATVERLADRLSTELLALFDTESTAVGTADAGDGEHGIVLFST